MEDYLNEFLSKDEDTVIAPIVINPKTGKPYPDPNITPFGVPKDHPNRCQCIPPGGDQCNNMQMTGKPYCVTHQEMAKDKKKSLRSIYDLKVGQYQMRVSQQANHPLVKSLREELGVLRMTLETHLNMCKDDQGRADDMNLLMREPAILLLVDQIHKLVRSVHFLDKELGAVLDLASATEWVQEITAIIAKYVIDPLILQSIGDELITSLDAKVTKAQDKQK